MRRKKRKRKKPEYDIQQREDPALREYEDARRRLRKNMFGPLGKHR